jgi:hypothetical protein
MKKALLLSATVLLMVGTPTATFADVIYFSNQGAFNTQLGLLGLSDLSVDFIPGSTGNPLQGQTSDGLFYDFSTTDTDGLRANGTNQVESADTSYNNLNIDAALSNIFFRSIRFQINPDGNPDDETLTFVVQDQFGANAPHQVIVDGPNTFFFGAISINGQLIDSLSFGGVELDRIQNVEIGGAAPVPEPGTLLLFGSGLAVVITKMRKRFRSNI